MQDTQKDKDDAEMQQNGSAMRGWFAMTLTLSAWLVFWSQPMLARAYLPSLGGAASVWATSLCLFQGLLCAGYVYAHALRVWLPLRVQAAIHLGLWGLVMVGAGPLHIPAAPPDAAWLWLASSLLQSIGPAFFWLSATAPLLQHWFAHLSPDTTHRDPYRLYVASNLGSFLALLAYPLLIELLWTLQTQWLVWRATFAAMGILILRCALALPALRILPQASGEKHHPLGWIFYAAVPSALLVSITQYITTDIAPAPMLWVLPLAMFLATFVWVFSTRPIPWEGCERWQAWLLLPVLLLWLSETRMPWWFEIPLHGALFWVSVLLCHATLAAKRPSEGQLTRFYSWMAFGGMLGGLFASLLAPLLFSQTWEMPLLLLLASFGRKEAIPEKTSEEQEGLASFGHKGAIAPTASIEKPRHRPFLITPSASRAPRPYRRFLWWFFGCFALSPLGFFFDEPRIVLQWAIGCILLFFAPLGGLLFRWMGRATVVVSMALFLGVAAWALRSPGLLHQDRGFFGPMRVIQTPTGDAHLFLHGRTLHGLQRRRPQHPPPRALPNAPTQHFHLDPSPTAYFSHQSPLGQLFQAQRTAPPRHLCIFGLGIGTLAAYGRTGETLTFFEIDPKVAQIAQDTRFFRYLSQSPAKINIHLIDARAGASSLADHSVDILIQDAFSSDAIPFHLLTAEAFALYLRKLKPHGLLVFHITNQFVDLEPILAEHFAATGLDARIQEHNPPRRERFSFPSRWVVATAQPALLQTLWKDLRWRRLRHLHRHHRWTDQRSSLLPALKRPW
ncbi:fused MFS/spermidine synthase [Myxococcota bacterium]|nr:fused MFS/spermidine synthase [Myxococcota bacterium]